ncbi:MAG: hypothetical protein OHK005_14620 [Candidatus Methylacidiphilales bacterium]
MEIRGRTALSSAWNVSRFFMRLVPSAGLREELAEWLATALEGCYGENRSEAKATAWKGGRAAGLAALRAFSVEGYASRRNYVPDDLTTVSRLSPYLRHGMLSLREVAETIRDQVGRTVDSVKFWAELGWRVFWRAIFARLGSGVYQDLEPAKVPLGSHPMPADVIRAETGLVCMDEIVRELVQTGYIHNHARMWFASYLIHHRKVAWQEGERFFYRHLLDGDPASNALSWQWVASTFSSKPYIFNRDNVEKYTGGSWCMRCQARCPFEGSYPELEARLFSEGKG